jgi:hypothetical protein
MSVPIYTIKAETHYSEDEVITMWLTDHGYCAVRHEIMSVMGSSEYQRKAGEGPLTLLNQATNRYEMHPELIAKLRRKGEM